MEPRGRGRARGRGREAPAAPGGQPPQQQRGGAHRGGGGRPMPPGPPQQAGPWSRAPQPQQPQQQAHWVRPQLPTPSSSAGRGSRLGAGDTVEVSGSADIVGAIQESGGDTVRGGRTEVRGRSNRSEIFRSRPATMESKKGTSGNPISLISNYFAMETAGKWALYQYRVDFVPDIDHTGVRKGLFREAMKDVLNGYLFDGTVMFTPTRLSVDLMEKFVQDKNGQNIRITIKLVGDLAWGDRAYQQVFNILIRKCLQLMKFQIIGRDFFDPQAKTAITDHMLELWPGYKTSIRQHEMAILMNCEMAFKVMRTDNVYDMLCESMHRGKKEEFLSKIIGQVVLTYYNNKTYRIDDVDFESTPMSTFQRRDGSEISYMDYFRQRYGIQIQVTNQPVLVSRAKAREIRAGMSETVVLIPELCQLTGISDAMRNNFHLMRSISDHTRVNPDRRIEVLHKFSTRLQRCPEAVQELQKYDLKFSDKLIQFQGRTLQPETIVGGNNFKCSAGPTADWTRDLRNMNPVLNVPMEGLVVITPSRSAASTRNFMSQLCKAAGGMGMNFNRYDIQEIRDDRITNYLECIEGVLKRGSPSLIICVVSSNSSDRYSALKKKCCVDRGVPTQVVVARTLDSKGLMSIATKIAVQLNCKVGGAPWTIIMPMSGLMVVGYDVCRDTVNKGKCFAAMVASLDRQFTRYFNHTVEHKYDEEISNSFAGFLCLACSKYKEVNGRYPTHIIIYRDGVGDGQLPYVRESEVETIKKQLIQEIYKDPKDLKMAFVVVSKRINTRIFTQSKQNPPPGTVADDVITLPERYDFYIVSQCVRQGSVSPTSYHVIFDEMGLNPDKLQQLTYKLCHVYYNWSGTIRVPAPVQYAHKLAFLTSQYLHRQAHRTLESLLFFL